MGGFTDDSIIWLQFIAPNQDNFGTFQEFIKVAFFFPPKFCEVGGVALIYLWTLKYYEKVKRTNHKIFGSLWFLIFGLVRPTLKHIENK
jgi:hypothetical protein